MTIGHPNSDCQESCIRVGELSNYPHRECIRMRSVIMIAYSFPPEGNAGVYRPLRFVRYLPTMGWNASVISLDTHCYERYDPGLLDLVPSATEVIRVRRRDPSQSLQ